MSKVKKKEKKQQEKQTKKFEGRLADVIAEDSIILNLTANDKEGVIRELVEHLAKTGRLKKKDVEEVVERVLEREKGGSTGIGNGVAIPHIKQYEGVKEMVGVLGCKSVGIDFKAIDGAPCHLIFLLLTPEEQTEEHLKILRKIALLARDAELCAYLRTVNDGKKIRDILISIDSSS